MKKFFKISAAVLSAGIAATLAGCSGCAGCNKNAKNTALTNSNWYTGTSYKGIQPSFILDESKPEYTKEELVYSVEFDGANAGNNTYSVEYKDGNYVTEFYAVEYDWNGANIPQNYKRSETEIVYCYKSQMNIPVRFTMKTGDKAQSEWFEDSAVNECYFRAAGKNLQPVYSRQTLISASPANLQPGSLASAYKKVDVTYESFYNYNCTEVTTTTQKAGEKAVTKVHGGLDKVKNSLFDNSSLYIAVRSMKLSSSFSQTISLYSAADGGVAARTVYGSDAALTAEERKTVTDVLKAGQIYTEENSEDPGVTTVAASISYTGGKLTGTAQTLWYAAIKNADNNVSRSTLLKMTVPLSFYLGSLNFTLQEVKSTLWNG